MIKSDVADMKNIGGRYGGSITAAQFLQRFIKEGTRHGPTSILPVPEWPPPRVTPTSSWGSGFGVRLLNEADSGDG